MRRETLIAWGGKNEVEEELKEKAGEKGSKATRHRGTQAVRHSGVEAARCPYDITGYVLNFIQHHHYFYHPMTTDTTTATTTITTTTTTTILTTTSSTILYSVPLLTPVTLLSKSLYSTPYRHHP